MTTKNGSRPESRGARLLKSSRLSWLGLTLLPLSVWLFSRLLKTTNRPNVTTTLNDYYKAYFTGILRKNGFTPEMVKMVFSQAAFETGNFTSEIFKENKNLFGMKLAKVRKTTAIGEARGHAVYRTWEDSIKDYWLYNQALGYLSRYTSVFDFVRALALKKYFEAKEPEYRKGVEYYYKLYFGGE